MARILRKVENQRCTIRDKPAGTLAMKANNHSFLIYLGERKEAGCLSFYLNLFWCWPICCSSHWIWIYFDKDILLLNVAALLHIAPGLKFGDCVSYFSFSIVWLSTFRSVILGNLSPSISLVLKLQICNQILCDCM